MVKKEYTAAGIMSGTSLDGTDIAICRFSWNGNQWHYSVEAARTFPYSPEWKQKLVAAETCSGLELMLLHKEYGYYLGNLCNSFFDDTAVKPDLIASHGHTIFHQPGKRLTFQIGDGACIAATTGITTVSDFRNLDVVLGGQGAPLVPAGDEMLFGGYGQCLNLGGFANISFNDGGIRKAYDICPVNIVLNYLAWKHFGMEFDKDGALGKQGHSCAPLLQMLNELEFFSIKAPKSLGKEWVIQTMLPLIESYQETPVNLIRTVYENIALQLAREINTLPGNNVLVTGGGAYNTFLLSLIRSQTRKEIIVPGKEVVEFKEALIFAFLGVLRYLNQPNCLAAVTGAPSDSSGGIIHLRN